MAIVEDLIFGRDGLVCARAAHIRSANGITNRFTCVCLLVSPLLQYTWNLYRIRITAQTFLLAFQKFSDNGSTYLSAAEELHSLMQLPEVKEELGKKGVLWRFIPKRTPWYRGSWEHLIGFTKTAIKRY